LSLERSDSVTRYRFRKAVQELDRKVGRGTELISVYVPPGKPISDVTNYLRQEYGTAANIKSKSTRKNVQDAIEKAVQRLKLFKSVPHTGLIVFSGAIPQNGPGSEKIEVSHLVPPQPISTFWYTCDSKFNTQPLKEMLVEHDVYGIVVIDNDDAAVAVVQGRSLPVIKTFTSGVPGKHRAGGQSARRFERLREASLNEYYKRIAGHANKIFLEHPDLKGVILAGPGPTKENFAKADLLHYTLKDKLHIIDSSYSGESGVREAIEKSMDILKELRYVQEKKLMQEFLKNVGEEKGLAAYGLSEVRNRLAHGAVETLLISEGLEIQQLHIACSNCGYKTEELVPQSEVLERTTQISSEKCPTCGNQTLQVTETKPLLDVLIDEAEKRGVNVELISAGTEEGEMLRKAFGGIAAILRY